jgi:hypothetical protein
MEEHGLDLSGSIQGEATGFSEHGNEFRVT